MPELGNPCKRLGPKRRDVDAQRSAQVAARAHSAAVFAGWLLAKGVCFRRRCFLSAALPATDSLPPTDDDAGRRIAIHEQYEAAFIDRPGSPPRNRIV
jgi:hypothetical protein